MANIPDFKSLTDKLDLDSIVANVKQMINPEDQMPHPEASDKLGQLIAECSALAHDIAREHEVFAKHNEQLHVKLNQLFKALRDEPKVKEAEADVAAKAEAAKAEEAKAAPADEPKAEAEAKAEPAAEFEVKAEAKPEASNEPQAKAEEPPKASEEKKAD